MTFLCLPRVIYAWYFPLVVWPPLHDPCTCHCLVAEEPLSMIYMHDIATCLPHVIYACQCYVTDWPLFMIYMFVSALLLLGLSLWDVYIYDIGSISDWLHLMALYTWQKPYLYLISYHERYQICCYYESAYWSIPWPACLCMCCISPCSACIWC